MIPERARRRARPAVDGVLQAALGAGMVAMTWPSAPLPLIVLYGFAGLWFAARSLAGRRGHDAHHALMAAAMAWMLSPGGASKVVALPLTAVFAVTGACWLARAGAFRPCALSDRKTQTPDEGERPMVDLPRIASREEWLTARKELLREEKEVTLRRDALAARRRELPMVKVDKDYVFDAAAGKARLLDLFEGRRQLVVYHFMFGPDDTEGHNSCALLVDNIAHEEHLHALDTTVALVSRAPIARLTAFRERMGWTIPWYSSLGSDFNFDHHVTNDESVAPVEYNYKDKATLLAKGTPWYAEGEWQGLSVFVRDGDEVYHTYSTYERGLDQLVTTYTYLDLTPLGRQAHITKFSLHDQYASPADRESHIRISDTLAENSGPPAVRRP
ncbi:DUF5134 domain-containing protein [Amycolatopsis sp. NPDC049691]|uniref:DUF5134 domain-containing protein n=1 Tax=Amycolatopsis sp. NPDC049691 TaxID=3155155 RepID=UPI00343923FE